MAITVTNTVASQSLRGQSVKVTVDQSDVSKLSSISVGDACEIDSNNTLGYVASVDLYGYSFLVNPVQPDKTFSSTPGYLEASETITITN